MMLVFEDLKKKRLYVETAWKKDWRKWNQEKNIYEKNTKKEAIEKLIRQWAKQYLINFLSYPYSGLK